MNKHFEDALYYFGRAVDHLVVGLSEEFEPFERRAREALGREREEEPEPTRVERIQTTAQTKGKRVVGDARKRLEQYRGAEPAAE